MSETPFVCPRCNGQGHTWTPPQIPGDQPVYSVSKLESHPCPPCGGTGILWRSQPCVICGRQGCHLLHDGEDRP